MDFLQLADGTALGAQGLGLLLGVTLMLLGARLYGLAIVAPGLALGVAVGFYLPEALEPAVRAVAGLVVAGVGALFCRFVERAAVSAFGAVLMAGLTQLGWPLVMDGSVPWWGALVGGAVGLLLFPKAFRVLLIPLTATLGALLVAFGLGHPGHPLLVAGLACAGTIAQLLVRRPRRETVDED